MVIVLGLALLYGCAPQETTGPANDESKEIFHWTMQSAFPSSIITHRAVERFVKEVEIATSGRLVIDLHEAGAIVPAFEVLEAVSSGSLDAGAGASTYWMGKQRVLSLFTSVPGAFEPMMTLTWLFHHGGLELYQKAYDQINSNVVVYPYFITHPEIFLHSHAPIVNKEDFRGLKLRAAADFVDIFEKMGASVTMLPGTEVYPSLEKKVIDAAEYGTPNIDRALAFHEITDYVEGPGLHQPAVLFEVLINKDSWNKLPDDIKQIVKIAARSTLIWFWTEDLSGSIETLEFYEDYGNTLVSVDEETQKEFIDYAWEYLDGMAKTDPLFDEVWSSMKKFYFDFVEYEDFMVPIRSKVR